MRFVKYLITPGLEFTDSYYGILTWQWCNISSESQQKPHPQDEARVWMVFHCQRRNMNREIGGVRALLGCPWKEEELLQGPCITFLLLSCCHVWLFCNPMNCSPPGFSVHEIFQARILQGITISFSRVLSRPRDWTCVSCTCLLHCRQILYHWATREAHNHYHSHLASNNQKWLSLEALHHKVFPCSCLAVGRDRERGLKTPMLKQLVWIILHIRS